MVRDLLFHEEAMAVRSRYQGGACASAQDHEVIAGQGSAAACEGGGGCADRCDLHHGACCRDVVAGYVAWDRPACADVVVQQLQSWRGQVRPELSDADVRVIDVVEIGLFRARGSRCGFRC